MGQVFPTDYSVLVHVSVPFLSVYFMVLCLSLHLIEPDTCRILNIGFDEATELSKKMYNAAQACLYVSDFIGNHSLEALQCLMLVFRFHSCIFTVSDRLSISLMGVYQQNLDEAECVLSFLSNTASAGMCSFPYTLSAYYPFVTQYLTNLDYIAHIGLFWALP